MISKGTYNIDEETKKKALERKHYKIRPIPSIWMVLTIATFVLGILKLIGATYPLWVVFLPLGLPIALCVAMPVYVLLAIMAVILFVFGLIVVAIPPCIVLMLVFGVQEKIEDHNLGM